MDEAQKQWIDGEVAAIGQETIGKLVAAAIAARVNVYAPYSQYKVGAAVLSHSGAIFGGCNIEVASYSESTHAEQNAITTAIKEGEVVKHGRKFLRAVAVSHESDSAPCGHCRQIIAEHADNAIVLWTDPQGKIRMVTSLAVLLPFAFTPTDLGIR